MRKKKQKTRKVNDSWKRTYADYNQDTGMGRFEKTLVRVEKRIEKIPVVGQYLSKMPVMMSMVINYISGNYRDVPVICVVIAGLTLIYLLNIADTIPDILPVLGYLDDAIVFTICIFLLDKELRKFKRWRDN